MSAKAFICGCAGPALSAEEIAFVKDARPWGLILFRRNVEDREQVRALTSSFRDALGRDDAPVLVDQEGGRVQRLTQPHWRKYPSAAFFERMGWNDPYYVREMTRLSARLMGADLREVGITVDCAPVADVPAPGSHEIVGDRAYAADPARAAVLARAAAEGLIAAGVLPVIKHMPGHGRARAHSHHQLPRVVYSAFDPDRPATTSRKVVKKIMRGALNFDGLIMSDDLSMKALDGEMRQRAAAVFAAGLDIALHCNGDLTEMRAVAEEAPKLSGKAKRRAKAALGRIAHEPEPFDPVDAGHRLDQALAPQV